MHGIGRKLPDKVSKRARFCELDHLVITAPTLAAGTAWAESILGVTLQAGGEHQRMATHNALLRLGNSTYLEVIAPIPAAPRPNQPRWFELDRIDADALPRLVTWVARTGELAGPQRWKRVSSPVALGQLPLERAHVLCHLLAQHRSRQLSHEGADPG